jgi:hypothetical protein
MSISESFGDQRVFRRHRLQNSRKLRTQRPELRGERLLTDLGLIAREVLRG